MLVLQLPVDFPMQLLGQERLESVLYDVSQTADVLRQPGASSLVLVLTLGGMEAHSR